MVSVPLLSIPSGDFQAFVFDCDGTLADTMSLHYSAWCETLCAHGLELSEKLYHDLGGATAREIVVILNERYGCQMSPQETAYQKEIIFHRMLPRMTPIEPVVRLARSFHGRIPLGVASGGSRVSVESTLKALGILDLFATVVTNEDYACGKPAPDAFLEAAKRLGVLPKRCLAFEDTLIGVQSAESAGMTCVRVPASLHVPNP